MTWEDNLTNYRKLISRSLGAVGNLFIPVVLLVSQWLQY